MRYLTTLAAACLLLSGCDTKTPPASSSANNPAGSNEIRSGTGESVNAPGTSNEGAEIVYGPSGTRNDTPPNPPLQSSPDDAPIVKVNLNTATREQFLALPEVTERMAHEFDEYRPYVSIRQFRREIGKYVDEAQIARYEQYVFVPIDINESDAETLQQIPGLSAEMATAIVAARPFASADEFLAALTGNVDADVVEIARTYLAEAE